MPFALCATDVLSERQCSEALCIRRGCQPAFGDGDYLLTPPDAFADGPHLHSLIRAIRSGSG